MANRTLLCVDPDDAAVSVITNTLEPYGFSVRHVRNGDQAVEFARKESPSLMVVSIEPKKIGYAICNKLKRSEELKKIPLILMSSEETTEKFEQHKTFKLRADEYILKPLDRYELMRKVNMVVGLEETEGPRVGPTASEEIFVDSELISSEISIDADDIVEEEEAFSPTPPPQELARPKTAPPAVVGNATPISALASLDQILNAPIQSYEDPEDQPTPPPVSPLDSEFAEEVATQLAPDAALSDENRVEPGVAVVTELMHDEPTGQTPLFDLPPEEEKQKEAAVLPSFVESVLSEPASESPPPFGSDLASASEIEGEPERLRNAYQDVPPGPEDVINTAVVSVPVNRGNESAMTDLKNKVHTLEDDNRRLQSEVEDLRQRLQKQPFTKEKDLLTLREVINRKEKDLLELHDALDAKDRQILDQRDRVREHERARRDLEEKNLTLERNLVVANERVTTLSQEKQMAVEHERGLKARLDDALTQVAKAYDEVESLKKRLAAAEERGRQEVDRIRQELEARLEENDTSHREELARMKDDREAEKAAREDDFRVQMDRLAMVHAAEIETLQKRQIEEKASMAEGHEVELARLRREHEKALTTLRDELLAEIENLRQTHQDAMELKEREQKLELSELRRAKESELVAAEDRRRREVEAAELRRTSDLDAAEARRRSELQTRDEQHNANIADLERRFLAAKNDAMERQRIEIDQVLSRATLLDAELAGKAEELADLKRLLTRLEAENDTTRADLRDREGKLVQMRDRITDLEAKTSDLEDQVLRAYRKIREDDKSMDKAKRALGVALTLLDERSNPSAGTRIGDENQG